MDRTVWVNSGRVPAIDRFRGFAMAMMIAFGASKMFTAVDFFGQLSTHDLSEALLILPGYGFYDVIAPLFIFASGLSFFLSFSSASARFGWANAVSSSFRKALKVIGLGALLLFAPGDPIGIILFALTFVAIGALIAYVILRYKKKDVKRAFSFWFDKLLLLLGAFLLVVALVDNVLYACSVRVPSTHWNVLPSIGLCMICALPFMRLSPTGKTVFSYLLTLFYFALCHVLPEHHFVFFTHGGMLGALGYALLFFYAVTFAALSKENKFLGHAYAATLCILAVASFSVLIPSKSAVNVSYALISFGFCYVLYALISFLNGVNVKRFPVLTVIGQNALFVYTLHFFLTFTYGIIVNALVDYIPLDVPAIKIALCFVGMLLYVVLMAFAMQKCNKKGIRFKL